MENTEYNEFNQDKNNSNKLIIALLALSIVINGVLGFVLMQKNDAIEQLTGTNVEVTAEKDKLEVELNDMLAQYDSLETSNDTLMEQLGEERAKVEELIAKVKSGNWTIYKLKKETESLRKIMKGFVVTIDSLNTANQQLMSENEKISGELGKERDRSSKLESDKDQLSKKVAIGERMSSVFIEAYAQRVKGNTIHKRTEKASRADKIKCCFTIAANELTKSGKKMVYLRVIGPSGKVLTLKDNQDNMFEFDGVRGLYSVKKEIIYENVEIDVCMYWVVQNELASGKYIVYAYADGHEIGVTEFSLK
ncbi:MAG: hypothetical protein CL840_19720 [Crocinitomicaceae bacterium]|nr:hypothetical protein [Crocinitomicaceae bacterium]|tara:strand:- start:8548 stop:9468 length:921 start_codon:yes stop_codon:yes gene_type:complete